LTPLFL